jgi:hypothetical protein
MAFHLSHIHDYDRFLAVDIGSYRVRTGVYTIESLDPVLLGFSSIRQNRKNMIAWAIADMRGVSLSIERSMIQASQKVDTIPKDAILAFSSSQFISDQITTQYIRKAGTPIGMHEVDTMVKKVEKDSFDRVRERARTSFGIVHDDLKLVSSTITAIEIDGKPVSNPIGFTGIKVRLSILNLFAPASEFNVVRSVASHIGKNIISLIPTPLVFPKLLEKSNYVDIWACIIDIGLLHTTIICMSDNSVVALETFPFGSQMLMDLLGHAHGDLTLLQIEHMLAKDEYSSVRRACVEDFFAYIIDTLRAFLSESAPRFSFDHVFCHGSIFESQDIYSTLAQILTEEYHRDLRLLRFSDILECETDMVVTHGLAEIATELLMVKKDPLVRILRYVLYNYE